MYYLLYVPLVRAGSSCVRMCEASTVDVRAATVGGGVESVVTALPRSERPVDGLVDLGHRRCIERREKTRTEEAPDDH